VVVSYLGTAYPISERRACRIVRCARASYRYRSHRDPRTALRQRMREMAQTRVRYGYRKIRVLLNREGWAVGKTLVYRLYREEGLTLRQRPPRRRKAVVPRAHRPPAIKPNDAWTLDFVADQLANGLRFRALTVVDVFTRESIAIEVGQSLRGEHVVTVLNRLTAQRGAPTRLLCDNGSEFCSQIVDLWAYQHHVRIDFSRPGKPTDNAHVESFNATLRRECLNVHWFESLHEAKERIAAWRREYNESRPHRALQDRTPEEFARAYAENHLCEPVHTAGNSP
jgi:Transposase and inactivated derivatives